MSAARLPLFLAALLLLLAPCAGATLRAQTPTATDSAYAAAMNAGYDALRTGDTVTAVGHFERAITASPGVATPHVQLGYIRLAQARPADAARHFEEALARDPELDDVRRQVGYVYASLGRTEDALAVFTGLRRAGRDSAQDRIAIGNLEEQLRAQSSERGAGAFLELYLAPFYQDRFDNTIGLGFARAGVTGGSWWQPSAYLSLRATRDSRSTGGQQPILFNDNTAIPAVGVRVRPGGEGLVLYAEAGAAYDLVERGVPKAWRRDLRVGANYAFLHEQPFVSAARPRLVTELAADATWYERFDRNVIGFGQLRESLRFGRPGRVMFDVYGRLWAAGDSRGEFFNRVAEGGGGVALHVPVGQQRVSVYVDLLRGRYFEAPPATSGLPRSYDDWRVTVATGAFRFFPFAR